MVAEENLRGFDGGFIVSGGVYHCGDFLGQTLLQRTCAGILSLLLDESGNLLTGQFSEYLDIFFSISVRNVEPELVELVGRGVARIEPHIAAFGLAEFSSVGLGDQRASKCVGLASGCAADKFCAGGYVAPLVGTAELQTAVFLLVEVEEVIALAKLIGEFGERHALL